MFFVFLSMCCTHARAQMKFENSRMTKVQCKKCKRSILLAAFQKHEVKAELLPTPTPHPPAPRPHAPRTLRARLRVLDDEARDLWMMAAPPREPIHWGPG